MFEHDDNRKNRNENPAAKHELEPWEAEEAAGGAAFAKYDGLHQPPGPPRDEWIDVLS
ncbi:MAG: hypothetical protein ACYTG1_00905 [Planctomycetota bacterium]|jgi:hypothetical protein